MSGALDLRAPGWMFGALLSFCLLAVGARELSNDLPTIQVLFLRSLIGLTVIASIILLSGDRRLFRTRRLGLHVLRNLFHFAAQYGWFLGIAALPLAEVFALEFTVPLWTALIAATFLRERLTLPRLGAIGLGILGVAVIVQPALRPLEPATLIVLGAALGFAGAHTTTKSLSRSEHTLTILLMMCLIQLPIGLAFTLPVWQTPRGVEWLWVFAVSVTALSAHFCLARAMLYAEVTTIVIMDFLRLPAIALVGVLLYAEQFQLSLALGTALMVAGNLINISSQTRRIRDDHH